MVIATKTPFRGKEWRTPQQVVASLEDSLRLMGNDHVDVFNLHGVELPEYDYALNVIAPASRVGVAYLADVPAAGSRVLAEAGVEIVRV